MKLPPMNALRAFEAVSRLGSVSRAAEELCVSQGAVSQQLRNLEDNLGRELFNRTPNSLELSEEGQTFAKVVQSSLGDIAEAARRVTQQRSDCRLTISTWQSLAIKWLMPNLGKFYSSHPGVTVALHESTRLATFKNDGVDAAIRYSDGKFDGLNSVFLFRPKIRAVASPEYLQKHGRLKSLADPSGQQLIEHQYPSSEVRSQHVHWEDLVATADSGSNLTNTTFPNEHQGLNAALQGLGIALISTHLIEEELADGRIEYACSDSVDARFSVYFVWPSDARPNPALDSFRDWLVEASASYRDE